MIKMTNGLTLSLNEFKKLPNQDKLICLYENQVKTLQLIQPFRYKQYIQWAWLGY